MGDLFAPSHILLVLIVALLLFGPKKLPELGRAFGKTVKEFKSGIRGAADDDVDAPSEPANKATAAQPKPQKELE